MRKEKQLFNYLKCKVMNKKFYWLAGFAALMMTAACSDDNVVNDNPDPTPGTEVNEYVGEMQMYDAASQAGRVHVYPQTRALKSERLSLVAEVDVPTEHKDYNWSATSLYFDADKSLLYATWHSNMQATTGDVPAVWGGAFDVFSINVNEEPEAGDITADYFIPEILSLNVAANMKFEHVMRNENNLFISGTQVKNGGGIARVDVSRVGNPSAQILPYEIIGFPGSSVNATAVTDEGKIIAISGYTGTYGTFEPNIEAGAYEDEEGNLRKEISTPRLSSTTWGGKYVTADGKYLLRDDENEAVIIDTEKAKNQYKLGYKLLSAERSAEKYEVDENGKFLGWELVEGTEAQKYGKHVLVVRNGFAYVAAGWNGLRVHNLNADGAEVRWQTQDANSTEQNNGPYTIGLFADDEYLYAATSQGLRVYTFKEDGGLELFAFEVENYDDNGAPQRDEDGNYQPAQTETEERHSCNFVVANKFRDGYKYIYVAYGKSGLRVYKLNPDAAETTKPEN